MESLAIEYTKKIREYFFAFYNHHGYSPTVRNIAEHTQIGIATVHKYLHLLEKKGVIVQADGRRGFVIPDKDKSSTKSVPKVGSVSCGLPMFSEENIERYITLPECFFNTNSEYFFLTASGDSMIGAGINDGDLVLVRKEEVASCGDIVVALTQDGENTLKRLQYDDNGRVILHPENRRYKDIYCDYIEIQGIAEKIVKELN